MQNQPNTIEAVANFQEQLRAIEIEAHRLGLQYEFLLMAAKRQFIIGALDRNKWNQRKAARELGMHRNTIRLTMEQLKISVPNPRRPTRGIGRRNVALSFKAHA